MQGNMVFGGRVKARVIRERRAPLSWKLRNLPNLLPGLAQCQVRRLLGMSGLEGRLYVRHLPAVGPSVNYGLVSTHLVTTAFVNFMVDQLQTETSEWGDFKYHDSGIGTTAANIADTDIETSDEEARATGTQTEGASANIYRSVGTISYTTTKAITEHGLFSTLAAATLMDRHVFAALNVVNGDSIEFTYELTCSAGG